MPKPIREFHLLMIDSSSSGKHLHAFMAFAINGWMRQLSAMAEELE